MRDIRVDDHRATELEAQQFSDLQDWERQIQREQLRRVSFGHDAGEIPPIAHPESGRFSQRVLQTRKGMAFAGPPVLRR
jgi:hypothetical protein